LGGVDELTFDFRFYMLNQECQRLRVVFRSDDLRSGVVKLSEPVE
jgi:hypothetical protein